MRRITAAPLKATTTIIKQSLGSLFSYLVGSCSVTHFKALLSRRTPSSSRYFGSSALFVSCGKDATEMKSSYKILLIPFWKTLLYIKRFAFYPPPTHMNPNYDPALINSDRHLPRRSLSLIMVDLSECRVFVCFPSATRETELINFSTLWRKGHFETINKDSGEASAELSIITSHLMNRELC